MLSLTKKRTMKLQKVRAFWLVVFLLMLSLPGNGQPPPPPGDHGDEEHQSPFQESPIGGGVFILLVLGAGYGAKKLYDSRKEW